MSKSLFESPENYKYWYVLTLNPKSDEQLWVIWHGIHPLHMMMNDPNNQVTWWSEIPKDVALELAGQFKVSEKNAHLI